MPYGTVNADVIGTSVTGSNLGAGNASIMKNRIINGAMVIDQRNAGASVSINDAGAYIVDRWAAQEVADGVISVQQVTTAPTGFNYSLKITTTTADSSLSAAQYVNLRQPIEGYNVADLGFGTASAKTVTVSFWVRSSLSGTFGGALSNENGDRSYPFTYTISSADTFEYKSVTIAGDTTGTWNTTNGVGLWLVFGLGVGSDKSGTAGSWQAANYRSATGAVSVIGTLNATFYITGVQLEVGSSATGFEYRQYGTELALCQRYYEKQSTTGSGTEQADFASGIQNSTTACYFYSKFTVTKRTSPTVSFSNIVITDHTSFGNAATFQAIGKGYDTAMLYATMSAAGAQYRPVLLGVANNTVGYIDYSAEL